MQTREVRVKSVRVRIHKKFSEFCLSFKMRYFFKMPLMASLNILRLSSHKIFKKKKLGKNHLSNFFCSLSKISKNYSRPIDIYLKCFMASAKTLGPPPTVPYSPLFVCRFFLWIECVTRLSKNE